MMMSGNIPDRVRRLAETLRNNGLAASDSQALEMAKGMVQTDERVMEQAKKNQTSMIKNYDVRKPAVAVENPLEQEKRSEEPPSTPSSLQVSPSSDTAQTTWEKEESAQGNPASSQGPAPSSSQPSASANDPLQNQAIVEAINHVKEQFEEATTQPLPEQGSVADPALEHLSVQDAVQEQPLPEQPAPSVAQQPPATSESFDPQEVQESSQKDFAPGDALSNPSSVQAQAHPQQPQPLQQPQQDSSEETLFDSVQQDPLQQPAQQSAPALADEDVPPQAPPQDSQDLLLQEQEQQLPPVPHLSDAPQGSPSQPSSLSEQQLHQNPAPAVQQEGGRQTESDSSKKKDASAFPESKIQLADVFNVNK